MSVSINILKYYGRYYPAEAQDARPMWWFCRTDETVISREELGTRYGYKNSDDAEQTGLFVPLFQVDMPALEKAFLKAFHFQAGILTPTLKRLLRLRGYLKAGMNLKAAH